MSRGLIELFEVPSDIILKQINIGMKGNTDMTIENHKGLVMYDNNNIEILSNKRRIKVSGCELFISEYNRNVIHISGIIEEVVFE